MENSGVVQSTYELRGTGSRKLLVWGKIAITKCGGSTTFPETNITPKNYFTSSDPHHDMLAGGCQVRVVIENMMGRMENLRTLISGFLGLVILVRWALELLRQAAASIGLMSAWSGQVRVDIQLISWNVFCYSQLRRLPGSNLLTFFLTYLLTFFLTYLLTFFLTYLLTFFLTSFWHIFWHSFWQIVWHSFWHIFWQFFWHIFRHAFWHIFWHSFWHIKTKT